MNDFGKAIMDKLEDIRRATLIGVKDTLTVDECAMLTGYSKQSLYALTSKRQIPHYKRGNSLYFSKQEVEQWMRCNAVPTLSDTNAEATTYTALNKR